MPGLVARPKKGLALPDLELRDNEDVNPDASVPFETRKGEKMVAKAEFPSFSEQGVVPIPGRVRLLIKLVETPAVPQPTFEHETWAIVIDCDCVRSIGLQLHRIRTCSLRGCHDCKGAFKPAEMISGELGHDIRPMMGSDWTPGDGNLASHANVRNRYVIMRGLDPSMGRKQFLFVKRWIAGSSLATTETG